MLGSTKWRVNRRVLSVVESIWAQGGNTAGLVDRKDVRSCSAFEISSYNRISVTILFSLMLTWISVHKWPCFLFSYSLCLCMVMLIR